MGDIWIESICINQTSLFERSAQVRTMDRVYSQARKVVMWLGLFDAMAQATIRTIYLPSAQSG